MSIIIERINLVNLRFYEDSSAFANINHLILHFKVNKHFISPGNQQILLF